MTDFLAAPAKWIAITLGAALACAAPAAFAQTAASAVTTTAGLVKAMQQRYGKTWYHTVTFVQETRRTGADGKTSIDLWDEAISLPSKLRIDYQPIKDGNGVLFVDYKISTIRGGKVEATRDYPHPLLLLGFDIYFLPEAEVMKRLADLKVDLSIFRNDTWQGKPSYVVGAKQGDLHSPQFWIDKENLIFTRVIRPAGDGDQQTSEYQFNKYQRLGGGWIAAEVLGFLDGKQNFSEEYDQIQADPKLDPKLYDAASWSTVHWEK